MEKIEPQFSLLGLATAGERVADAFRAFAESLRNGETATEEVKVRVPVATIKEVREIEGGIELDLEPTNTPDAALIFGGAAPPPPPVATPAPSPPVIATPAPPANIELAVAGHAWDERIHSGTRAKNKDGTWRTKRGVSAGVIAQVEAEQAGKKPASTKAAPVVPPPPAATADPGAMKFSDVVKKVQAEISAGKLTQAGLTEHCHSLGLNAFPELAKRPDLFGQLLLLCGIA